MKTKYALFLTTLFLSAVAFVQANEKFFKRIDIDKDNTVTKKEYLAFYAKHFAKKDKDSNRYLSEEEFGHSNFNRVDKNEDSKIQPEEFLALHAGHFNRRDTNKDGIWSFDEVEK